MAEEKQTQPVQNPASRTWTDVVIPLLMMAIIVILAALWFVERSKRTEVYNKHIDYVNSQEAEKQKLASLFRNMVPPMPATLPITQPVIQKQLFPTQKVVVDGKETDAVKIDKLTAQQIGLSSGDVVVVGQ